MSETHRARPRLLVLASTYPRWPGDPEPGFVHELCRRLAADFKVVALVPDAPGADPSGELDGVQVVRYRYAPRALETLVNSGGIAGNLRSFPWKWLLLPGFLLMQYLAARRLVARHRIDLVHAHWLLPQGLVAWLLRKRVPYVVTSHGGDLFGLRGRQAMALKRRVAADAAALSVVSTAMAEQAREDCIATRDVAVIPMGVDLSSRFVPDPAVRRSPSELLFVGRLVPKKGTNVLLDAMPAILAARPDVHLTIAGFGPEEAALRGQAARLGVAHAVCFVGPVGQEDLPALYRRAALLVAPFVRDASGNQEGLPVVMMEALGCACPVVVGDVAGVQDLLGDGHREIRVPPGDVDALTNAVLRELADPERAAQRARVLRESARFVEWREVAGRYATLLQQALPAHAAVAAA